MERASATDEEASARLLLSGRRFSLLKSMEISNFCNYDAGEATSGANLCLPCHHQDANLGLPLAWSGWMPKLWMVNDGSCRSDDRPVQGNFAVCSCACVQHVSEFRECG